MAGHAEYLGHGVRIAKGRADAVGQALESADVAGLMDVLPKRAHHRIAGAFPHRTVYLDIETTGMSRDRDIITMVGWSVGGEYGCLIHGGSTNELFDVLGSAKVLVTFNGSCFDLPYLRAHMPNLPEPAMHLDLRYFARKCALAGGQKAIEVALGLARPEEVRGLTGMEAPRLWFQYRGGNKGALRRLIEYNKADVEGMEVIAAHCLRWKAEADGIPEELWPDWLRVDPLVDRGVRW
jgi:uncharacterized protein YprB with RNaseH-like and TPR domain